MDQLLPLASLAEAWGSRGEALGARVPQERLSALLPCYHSRANGISTKQIWPIGKDDMENDDAVTQIFKKSGLYRNGQQLKAIELLVDAREAFDFSLGAYALLISEKYGPALVNVAVKIYEDGSKKVIQLNTDDNGIAGRARVTKFNNELSKSAAESVVDAAFARMIVKSFDAVSAYIKSQEDDVWNRVKKEPWFAFASHVRNAYAHDGRFRFNERAIFPAKFEELEITKAMEGAPVGGIITWYHGMRLCAEMERYVDIDLEQNA